jgi:hypothetical protein
MPLRLRLEKTPFAHWTERHRRRHADEMSRQHLGTGLWAFAAHVD